jgi:regulatory protein
MDTQTFEAARAVALRYIGYAARSQSEVERRLEKAAFPPEIIAAVVAELEARGWLDDAQFARSWIADRADRKKYGRGRLAAELRNKGIDKEVLEEALGVIENEEELERARAAARPKWRPDAIANADAATVQAEKRKLADFLQRRGFSWDIIAQVLSELMSNKG